MKSNNWLLVIIDWLISMILMSCGSGPAYVHYDEVDYSEMDTISFDYTKGEVVFRDSAFSNINYIVLETRSDNLIGMVDEVLFGDSTIIVVDKRMAKSIYLFDFNGKYIGRMSGMGRGRNEYSDLSDVSKRPDKLFAVFDEICDKIMYFNERGEFKGTYTFDKIYSDEMEYIANDIMAFGIYDRYPDFDKTYGEMSFAIKNYDMVNRYVFGKTELDRSFNYGRYYDLYSYGDTVYCSVNFQDVIYALMADSVKAKYRVIYGPENVTNNYYKTLDDYKELRKQYPYYEGEFVELKDYTYLKFRGDNGVDLFYKHSNKTAYALSVYFDDLEAFFHRVIARYGDNTIVCSLTAQEIVKNREAFSNSDDEQVKKLYSSIEMDSNPVLFFFEVGF